MKIAIIAPPWIPVPPPKYGGIETVIYNLVEGLQALGQDVTLFALKESKVSCKMYNYLETPLYFGMDSTPEEKAFVSELGIKYAYARSGYEKFDLIHDHTLFRFDINIPVVHTLYSAATEGAMKQCAEISENPKNYLVTVSKKQQDMYLTLNRELKFAATIHHGIDVKNIPWKSEKDDFFLCAGRASWEKGLDTVVRVAGRARVGLIMVVKILEDKEKEFFKHEIKPWIDKYPNDLLFQLFHELPRDAMLDLYKRAKCTLFTSQWEQPFGLVMIESMACGTPVIAFRRGAATEIIVHGVTGFVVNTEDEMVEAIKKIDEIDPEACRKHVEKNFSREVMTEKYLNLYKKITSKNRK